MPVFIRYTWSLVRQSSLVPMTESSFQYWWKQFLRGDDTAFGKLYRPFHQKLMLYCYRFLRDEAAAEDAASETLHKLYEYPKLDSVRDFERWLFTCARNLCLDNLAKNKRRYEIREEIGASTSSYYPPQAEQRLAQEEHLRLLTSVLTENELRVWQLHQEGYDNVDIAKQADLQPKTVANLKSMARQKLREALTKQAYE